MSRTDLTEKRRLDGILPVLERRVDDEMGKRLDVSALVKAFVDPMVAAESDPAKKEEMRRELTDVQSTILPIAFRPIFEMNEMASMAREGVANILRSVGFQPKTNEILRGFSGNDYAVNVVASTPKRLLIVDQMMLSADLLIPWMRTQLPRTFDSYKVTVADLFKYLDISLALEDKPTVYWLHKYDASPELVGSVGFSFERMARELERLTRAGAKAEDDLMEKKTGSMLESLDSWFSGQSGWMKLLMQAAAPKGTPEGFDVDKAARRFYIPYIGTQLTDMLEASLLDPKVPSASRTLKGFSVELGLIDFLNPPWPTYALGLASKGKATFDQIRNVLVAAEAVGHPASAPKSLGITVRQVSANPSDATEILESQNLVTVDQKEIVRITPAGKEYIREVHKRPQVSALRKALSWMSEHMSFELPGGFRIRKKD